MSDSGFTKFPSQRNVDNKIPRHKAQEQRTVEIKEISKELRTENVEKTIRGEVTRINKNGRATIRTPRGDINIQIPTDKALPPKGSQVEFTIQNNANTSTQTASINYKAPIITTPAQTIQTPSTSTIDRSTETPINIDVNTPQSISAQAPSTITPGALPPIGTIIRLTPYNNLITQTQNVVPPNQIPINTLMQPMTLSMIMVEAIQPVEQPVQNSISTNILSNIDTSNPPSPIATALTKTTGSINSNSDKQIKIDLQPITQSPLEHTKENINIPTFNESQSPLNAAQTLLPPSLMTSTPDTINLASQQLILSSTNITEQTNLNTSDTLTTINARIDSLTQPNPIFIPTNSIDGQDSITSLKNTVTKNEYIPITQNYNAGSVRAVITGQTKDLLPIISIEISKSEVVQNFILQAPVNSLTIGTELTLTPQTSTVPLTPPIATNIVQPLSAFLAPGQWPVMQELYSTLLQTNPALAQTLSTISPNLASPSAQLAPTTLFFIAAIRAGDMGGWLGDKTMSILRRDHRASILSRITQDSGLLSRLSSEPISQEWRALALPLFAEHEMQKMVLYYRHEHTQNDNENTNTKQMRFIFDLSMSNMGPVQLDGLFRPGRLDIILRTQTPFTQAMQSEMRRVYTMGLKAANDTTPITGDIEFQNKPEQWVTINIKEEHTNNVII